MKCGAAQCFEKEQGRVLRRPGSEAALAEEIFIIEAKFFEAGASYVGEFELGLFGSSTGLAAFGDILCSGAGCLHHLIVSAAVLLNVEVAESYGDIVDELSDLKGF